MAEILPPPKHTSHFSITKFTSKLRSRVPFKRSKRHESIKDTRPLLYPSPLPEHQHILSQYGWTTLTFPTPTPASQPITDSATEGIAPGLHPLQSASAALFTAVQRFFDLPDAEKTRWKHRLGSEEGWSRIPGEKEFITLRTLEYTPTILKEPAKRYWDLMGAHLSSTLGRISTSLGLPDGEEEGLRQFVGPCARMGSTESDKTSTMLRIFRYEGWDTKVVAEPHADLGLLSCVVGDVPGLEVWNGRGWFDVEKRYTGREASLLVGRQLERYSNGRYVAGGHRVVSYGDAHHHPQPPSSSHQAVDAGKQKYRHSIVFVLRAHGPVIVDSEALETPVTGKWAEPVKGLTAGQMYEVIRKAHFNINTSVDEREKQRERVQGAKGKMWTG